MGYYALIHLLFLTTFLPFSSIAQTNGNVAVGQSLTATENATSWQSPLGDFAFGFRQIRDTNEYLLAIWYNRIPDRTIVWYGHDGNTVPRRSQVGLDANRGLVLTDPRGTELWSIGAIVGVVQYGIMNDTGNFALVGRNSVLWDTFRNPTDTLLPTQTMEINGVLNSRYREMNFSSGRFQLRFLSDGNLVLNTREVASDFAYDAYYQTGTNDALNSSNSGSRVVFNETGNMYILRRNGERVDLTPQMARPTTEYYHRITLSFDGVLTHYFHPRNLTGSPNWTVLWFQPDNICVNIGGGLGSGACGYNSFCSLDDNGRPICQCPDGYSLLDPNDDYGSCKANFTQSCDKDGIGNVEEQYGFVQLVNIDWPTSDYERARPSTEEDCQRSCLLDCFCAVAILRDGCWKKKLPLSNGRRDNNLNSRAFLKITLNPDDPIVVSNDNGNDNNHVNVVKSVFFGGSVFVNFLLVGVGCMVYFGICRKKKFVKIHNGVETNLRCFSYKELIQATNGFVDELGRGSFGTVYKGEIWVGALRIVAVKKLNQVVRESDKEFKAEVNAIAETHHKNLVRLLGFCDEKENRLLVYEYMSNGTLASFLFGDAKPDWVLRTDIALGVAKGLLYLHEECNTQIIHCDIKPQNILLDEYNNGRIADFGLAKLLMTNQSRTETGIRGTKGYVAPEWFRNVPVSVKVDVYSFGVLLLEIISCRRNFDNGDGDKVILTDWAWDCFEAEKLDEFVENEANALNEWEKLERFVMVGIWCIQEDPSLRPNMRKVCHMLEGVVEVIVPPCPFPYSTL